MEIIYNGFHISGTPGEIFEFINKVNNKNERLTEPNSSIQPVLEQNVKIIKEAGEPIQTVLELDDDSNLIGFERKIRERIKEDPIAKRYFSMRTLNAFTRNEIFFVDELTDMTKKAFLNLNWIGSGALRECHRYLSAKGLYLKGEINE